MINFFKKTCDNNEKEIDILDETSNIISVKSFGFFSKDCCFVTKNSKMYITKLVYLLDFFLTIVFIRMKLKKVFLLIRKTLFPLMFILVFGMIGCSNNIENDSNTPEKASENEKASEDVIENTLLYSIGDNAAIESTLGNYEITLNSVNKIESLDGNNPQKGKFIEINTKFDNISQESLNIQEINDSRLTSDSNPLGYYPVKVEVVEAMEEILPNNEVTIKMYFDVTDESEFELVHGNNVTVTEAHWGFSVE
jgi:hypothetical protein